MAGVNVQDFPAVTVPVDADLIPMIDDVAGTPTDSHVTVANLRQVMLPWMIRANVNRTLPNDTNENAIFNDPTNGRITIPSGVYRFEMMMLVTSMSGTSGNALIDLLGAGTATITDWLWMLHGLDNSTTTTVGDDDAAYRQTQDSAASAVIAGTGTAMRLTARGMFNCTTGGTLIPSIDQVTAAAAVVQQGSYFIVERLGAANAVSSGPVD
jgi:hypothetical protein